MPTPPLNLVKGVCVIWIAILTHYFIKTQVQLIDDATTLQCLTHDWPEDKNDTMLQWCSDNDYDTTGVYLYSKEYAPKYWWDR